MPWKARWPSPRRDHRRGRAGNSVAWPDVRRQDLPEVASPVELVLSGDDARGQDDLVKPGQELRLPLLAEERAEYLTSWSWLPRAGRFPGSALCRVSQAVSAETRSVPRRGRRRGTGTWLRAPSAGGRKVSVGDGLPAGWPATPIAWPSRCSPSSATPPAEPNSSARTWTASPSCSAAMTANRCSALAVIPDRGLPAAGGCRYHPVPRRGG